MSNQRSGNTYRAAANDNSGMGTLLFFKSAVEALNGAGYDDAAFYYFTVAMLIIILIPATYNMIISPILYGDL